MLAVAALVCTAAAIGGGTPAERHAMHAVAARMEPSPLQALAIGPPPEGFGEPAGARWLTVTVRGRHGPASDVVGSWFATVAAGAVFHELAAHAPAGLTTVRVDGAGGDLPGSPTSEVAAEQPATYRTRTQNLAARLRRAARRAHARLTSLAFRRPEGPAPVADFRARDARVLAKVQPLLAGYEGYLVTIHRRRGRLIAAGGSARRLDLGFQWIAPSVQGQSGGAVGDGSGHR